MNTLPDLPKQGEGAETLISCRNVFASKSSAQSRCREATLPLHLRLLQKTIEDARVWVIFQMTVASLCESEVGLVSQIFGPPNDDQAADEQLLSRIDEICWLFG
jgi:hypothetical protein